METYRIHVYLSSHLTGSVYIKKQGARETRNKYNSV